MKFYAYMGDHCSSSKIVFIIYTFYITVKIKVMCVCCGKCKIW